MPASAVRNSFPVQLYRALRTCVHVLHAIALTALVFPWLDSSARRARVKRWSVRLLEILAVSIVVRGDLDLREGNVLVVANHVSWLDIFVLNAIHPVRFVAKAELGRWPIAGAMVRSAGTLLIERAKRHDTQRVNHYIAEVLAAGDVVAIFPESTTSDGATTLPFKSSLLQPIVEAAGRVAPVAIRYQGRDSTRSLAPAYVGDLTFMASVWRVCGEESLFVTLDAPPAIEAGGRHRRELARMAETIIQTALARA